MLVSTNAFLASIEKWVQAVRADDFAAARKHAEQLVKAGEALTKDPQFARCFQEEGADCEPKEALRNLRHFLVCATEGRATVLKRWLKENRPKSD